MNFRPLDYIDPMRLNLDWIQMKVKDGKKMEGQIEKIIEELNKADLPQGDYMDLEKLWNVIRDEDVSFNDILESFANVTNAILNIRAIIEN